jgi:hypothetical protein
MKQSSALLVLSALRVAVALKANVNDKNYKKTLEGKDSIIFFMAPW